MRQTQSPHLSPSAFYTTSLETWADAILCQSSEAEQCLLEQVVHYKATSGMEHEFLVVHACHPSSSQIVLGVDRNPQALAASIKQVSSATGPSSTLAPFTGYLHRLMDVVSLLFSASLSSSNDTKGISPRLAYDAVQVSHDGTPAPILAWHGPSVTLSTITFARSPPRPPALPCKGDRELEGQHSLRPSLLHLSILLLIIHTHFPSYVLLQYECYFFPRVTCLALIDIFGGVEIKHTEGRRAATWCGVHVSLWSAVPAALRYLLLLPLAEYRILAVPVKVFALYNALKIYDGIAVQMAVDRRKIRCAYPIFRVTSRRGSHLDI